MSEPNPLCSALVAELPSEDAVPDHCRPLSPDRDASEDPSPTVPEASTEEQTNGDVTKEDATFPEGGQEPPPGEAEPQYISESLDQDPRRLLSTGETSFEGYLSCL